MKSAEPDHPWLYFALVYGLSAPFWILSTQITHSGLPDNLPVTDIGAALTPMIAAGILRYREAGTGGVCELLLRTFDYRRIKKKRWLLTAVAILPLLYAITYFAMRSLAYSVPTTWNPSPALGGAFLLFAVAAAAEELGYSAYETDALQRRMTALNTAIVIGSLWAFWHLPSMIVMGQSVELILWGLGATVAFRVLSVRIYNNASASTFAVVLMHAVGNACRTGYPGGRTGYELGHGAVAYSIIIVFAVLVIVLWGPTSLARFSGRRRCIA